MMPHRRVGDCGSSSQIADPNSILGTPNDASLMDADSNTRIRTSFQGKGGYLQVCNDGTYDLMTSLAAGVTIIESINGTATNISNEDLYEKIIVALG